MELTPATVASEYEWVVDRGDTIVPLINDTRERLADCFGVEVGRVTRAAYREEVDAVFADGDRAVNVAGYVALLRDLDVVGDYPGFVVDEVLGRELAATVAGDATLAVLAQATFHVADVFTHTDGGAGADDLDAALAAGFQTRLPGWEWTTEESPFAVDRE
jgi:hypothetical protein